jgi:hypothetical protein
MYLRGWMGPAFFGMAALIGCGGGEERAVSPEPSDATPGPTQPAAVSPPPAASPAMTGSEPNATAPAAKRQPPTLQAHAPPDNPKPIPVTVITAPKANESVPAAKAADYEVRLEVKDWPVKEGGPHVHLILDNRPYKAIYRPKDSVMLKDLTEGEPLPEGQHVLVAFPSREGHVSVKPAEGAKPFSVVTFWVGKAGKGAWKPTDPTLIYSRPKGEYKDADADRIVIDFYLLNAELGAGKHAVKATVTPPAGDALTMTLTSWAPIDIVNLPEGESKVRLELLDKDGKPAPGSFNQTERSIKVSRTAK